MDNDDVDHLVEVGNLLYDEMDWLPQKNPICSRAKHECTGACKMVNSDRLYVCIATGNVHICTDASCDQIVFTSESKVCALTGNLYELEDRTIYNYDCADRNTDEPAAVGDDVRAVQIETDSRTQLGLVVDVMNTDNVIIRKRKRHVASSSSPSNSAPIVVDWQTAPSVTKKVKATVEEVADAKRHEVYALTIAFLSYLDVDRSIIDVHEIAQASLCTWSYIQHTDVFKSFANKYQPRVHVAVMLRCIQMNGLVYDDLTFAPHVDALSAYIKCPKVFAPEPFNIPSSKFTLCSTVLRKCLAEKARAK